MQGGAACGAWQAVCVRCRSEYRYAQEPMAIGWGNGTEEQVVRVIRRWRTPAGPGFRIATERGVFELRYCESTDRWQARACGAPIGQARAARR